MTRKVFLQEFLDSYRESLGVEGAQELLKRVIAKANLTVRVEYTKEEALRICEELKKHGGFVGIIGGILASRMIIR